MLIMHFILKDKMWALVGNMAGCCGISLVLISYEYVWTCVNALLVGPKGHCTPAGFAFDLCFMLHCHLGLCFDLGEISHSRCSLLLVNSLQNSHTIRELLEDGATRVKLLIYKIYNNNMFSDYTKDRWWFFLSWTWFNIFRSYCFPSAFNQRTI